MFSFGGNQQQQQTATTTPFSFKTTNTLTNPSMATSTPGMPFLAPISQSTGTVTAPPILKTTLFSDLPADLKQQLESLEVKINSLAKSSAIASFSNASFQDIDTLLDSISSKFKAVTFLVENENYSLNNSKAILLSHSKYSELANRICSRLFAGHSAQQPAINSSMAEFYSLQMTEFKNKFTQIDNSVTELYHSLTLNSQSHSLTPSPELISATIRSQHSSFIGLTEKIAKIDDQMDVLRKMYLNYRAKYFNDYHNPFTVVN